MGSSNGFDFDPNAESGSDSHSGSGSGSDFDFDFDFDFDCRPVRRAGWTVWRHGRGENRRQRRHGG